MKRIILLLSMVTLAGGAAAQDTPSASPAFKTKPPPSQAKPKSGTPKFTPEQQRIRDSDIAKSQFMAAVGSCPKPEDCDPDSPRKNPELVKMLKSAEEDFIVACAQCATDKACEEERARIRAGKGRFGENPCVKAAGKAKGSSSPDKKSSTSTKPTGASQTPK